MSEKEERLKIANEFIQAIASCGRNFFLGRDGFIAYLELNAKTGKVFFIDDYTRKRIYTHSKYGRWKGFSHGGTMRMMIEGMRDFITKGSLFSATYFQPKMGNGFGNPWGYGGDILKVKEAALKLGIAK